MSKGPIRGGSRITAPHPSAELMVMPPQSQASKDAAWRMRFSKGGYASPPGTGPEGETCGTCTHIYRKKMGKTYSKCNLMRAMWTGGYGTDIKVRAAACNKWETKPTNEMGAKRNRVATPNAPEDQG